MNDTTRDEALARIYPQPIAPSTLGLYGFATTFMVAFAAMAENMEVTLVLLTLTAACPFATNAYLTASSRSSVAND